MRARLMVITAAITAMVAGAVAWLRRSTGSDATPASGRMPGAAPQATPPAPPAPTAKEAEPEVAATAVGAAEAPAPAQGADDLQLIKGIGAVSAERLHDVGVTTFAEIAAWTPDQLDEVAGQIRISSERIRREDWVGQARAIADS